MWSFGKNGLWRDRLLEAAQTIYLTEGETDCISLIDCGVEEQPGVGVVAVPGAKAFKREWAERFSGKVVVVCFDNDETGAAGAQQLQEMLAPVAAGIRIWTPKEVK